MRLPEISLPRVNVGLAGQRRRRAMPWEAFVTIANKEIGDGRQWLRLGYVVGPASSSHRGHWHTKIGTIRGHNFRIGAPRTRHSLTMLAHLRRSRK